MIDWNLTADDYSAHRAGFSASLFPRLAAFGIGVAGQRVLDLGTGTGTLGRGFARQGARVIGLDVARAMLEQAMDARHDLATAYVAGRAERLPFPANSFEVVSAGQCWHWFDADTIYAETWRALKTGGILAICSFDWLPVGENIVAQTEALVERFNPVWTMGGGTGLYPQYLPLLGAAGFSTIETFSYDEDVVYSPEGWRGRMRASAGVGASLPLDKVREFDEALAALLAERFSDERLAVPHRVAVIVAVRL
jgi:SAM-dependent methyltransferase